jgi:hypothetical protein
VNDLKRARLVNDLNRARLVHGPNSDKLVHDLRANLVHGPNSAGEVVDVVDIQEDHESASFARIKLLLLVTSKSI